MKTLLASAKDRREIEGCYGLLSNCIPSEDEDTYELTIDLDHVRSIGASASIFHAYILLQYRMMKSWKVHISEIKSGERPDDITEQFATDLLRFSDTGWFTLPSKTIERDIRMSPARQSKYLKILQDAGLIKTARRGVPPRRFVQLMKRKFKGGEMTWEPMKME